MHFDFFTGVAFKKTFSYAGFEMQPKTYSNPKIALLNIELELKAEKENAEVRVNSVEVSRHWSTHNSGISSSFGTSIFSGISENRRSGVADSLWKASHFAQGWCEDCFVETAHWRCGHPVLRRSRHVLRWSRCRGGLEADTESMRRQYSNDSAGQCESFVANSMVSNYFLNWGDPF